MSVMALLRVELTCVVMYHDRGLMLQFDSCQYHGRKEGSIYTAWSTCELQLMRQGRKEPSNAANQSADSKSTIATSDVQLVLIFSYPSSLQYRKSSVLHETLSGDTYKLHKTGFKQ